MDPRPKCKTKTLKLLEENIAENFCEHDLRKGCFNIAPNTWLIKEKKMVIWNLSKLKPATFWKDIVKMIKVCHRLEENFANLTLDKGFLSRIYKGLLIFSNEKTNNPIKNGQNISTESLKFKGLTIPTKMWGNSTTDILHMRM